MKVLVIIALFAFVAVQVCQSAPLPEDDKVEVEKKEEVAPAAPVAAAESTDSPPPAVTDEVKTEAPSADAVSKAVEASTPAEVKKD